MAERSNTWVQSLRRRSKTILSSYWFVPTLMAAAAAGVSFLSLHLDRTLIGGDPSWAYEGDASGARAVLSTIAGSMITVAGVVFSITIVALSLASRQFGPLLLRNFMKNRPNQLVLGTFVATFLFCLLVLRAVKDNDGGFVPHMSVTLGIVLAVISLGVFIFFIHHIAQSIRADGLLARIGRELEHHVHRLQRQSDDVAHPDAQLPTDFERRARVLCAPRDGYARAVADEDLLRIACERDLVVEPLARPNDFVVCGMPLLRVYPRDRCDDDTSEVLVRAMRIGDDRDSTDDLQGGIEQLVQLCLRALSPSLNDPTTAKAAIDRMVAVLAGVARTNRADARYDETGKLRIVVRTHLLHDLIEQTLEPVRRNAARQSDVTCYLLESVAKLVPSLRTDEDRQVARELVRRIERTAEQDLLPNDRPAVEALVRRVSALVEPEPAAVTRAHLPV